MWFSRAFIIKQYKIVCRLLSSSSLLKLFEAASKFVIISSLLIYCIISGKYIYQQSKTQANTPLTVTIGNAYATTVACVYPRSGTFGSIQRVVFYGLIPGAVGLKWREMDMLAEAAAGYVMLYSSVAAIYQIVIFHYGNILDERPDLSKCITYSNATGKEISICHGVDDSDRDAACITVATAMLAALPISVWSKAFEESDETPVLLSWLSLLSVSNIFCALSATDTTRHYYIRSIESRDQPFLEQNYIAPKLNGEWLDSLSGIIENGTDYHIYSCFAPDNYPIGKGRQIGVYSFDRVGLSTTPAIWARQLGLAFWIVYMIIKTMALLIRREGRKRDFIQPIRSSEIINHNRVAAWLDDFCLGFSIALLVAWVLFGEVTHREVPESEPTNAVGQWGVIIALLFIAYSVLLRGLSTRLELRRVSPTIGMENIDL